MKLTQLRQIIREEISKTLNEISHPPQSSFTYEKAMRIAQAMSKEENESYYVNKLSDDSYDVSNQYDPNKTVVAFEDGIKMSF
jgi:hypothetical protein